MLIYEYKLRANQEQRAAIDEAMRTVQFVRNKCLRKWMDGRGVGDNELQIYCAELARQYPFAGRLNAQARQIAADRAWLSIARFYKNCREKKPGKKGYPRFQHDNRSVEYKTTGWQVEPDGKRLTCTDGTGIGKLRLIGTRSIETFPLQHFTTQECSACGERVHKSLSQRTHKCPQCGLVLDRDHNAARNILLAGLAELTARNRTAGHAGTGSNTAANASGQTASTAVFARARRKRAG